VTGDQRFVLECPIDIGWHIVYILLEKRPKSGSTGEWIADHLLGRDEWRLVSLKRELRGHCLLDGMDNGCGN
jgi:hypothetical protein